MTAALVILAVVAGIGWLAAAMLAVVLLLCGVLRTADTYGWGHDNDWDDIEEPVIGWAHR